MRKGATVGVMQEEGVRGGREGRRRGIYLEEEIVLRGKQMGPPRDYHGESVTPVGLCSARREDRPS